MRTFCSLFVGMFGLLSCAQADTPTPPTQLSTPRALSKPAEDTRSLDEHYGVLADSIAGVRLNRSTRRIIVMLTDLGQSARAEQVFESYRRVHRIGPDLPLEFSKVRFSWRQLEAWAAVIEPSRLLLGPPALRGFDIDEKKNRLFYAVSDQLTLNRLTSIISELGIPSDAFEVTILAPVVVTSPTINDAATYFHAGYQIRRSGVTICTADFPTPVDDGGTRRRAFVTASHCTSTVLGRDATAWLRPMTVYPAS